MSRVKLTLLSIPFVWTVCAAETPPLEIKGTRLGSPMAEVLAKSKSATCTSSGCYLTSEEHFEEACGPRMRPFTQSIGDCKAKIRQGFTFGPAPISGIYYRFYDDTVGQIAVAFPSKTFDEVIIALSEKYGAPSTQAVESLQNSYGAKYDGRVLLWRRGDGQIAAREFADTTVTSTVTMATHESLIALEREKTQKAKAAAKDL